MASDADAEREAKAWIEAVVYDGAEMEGTLQEALHSGVVLCRLLNTLKPGTVKKPSRAKTPFMQMENIASYVAGCKALGMPEFELFSSPDLYENHNMRAIVLNIHSLGRLAQNFYNGPTLGAKLAKANVRDFTEEQMQAGKNVVGGFGLGSSKAAQADAKVKLGLGPKPPPPPPEPEPEPEPVAPPAPSPKGGNFLSRWFGGGDQPPPPPPDLSTDGLHPPAVTAEASNPSWKLRGSRSSHLAAVDFAVDR